MSKILCLILLGALTGCSIEDQLDIAAFRVVSVSPAADAIQVPADSVITVAFSANADRKSVEEAFALSTVQGSVSGSVTWDNDRTMRFEPEDDLRTGVRYTVQIDRTAYDSRNNTMERDFLSMFTVGEDNTVPVVIDSDPPKTEGGAIVTDLEKDIRIVFSKEMNRIKTENAFSITPAVEGYFTWNATGTELTYVTIGTLDSNEQYTIRITAEAEDRFQITLQNGFLAIFRTDVDLIKPQIALFESTAGVLDASIVNSGLTRDDRFTITFSEEMNRSSVEAACFLEPDAQVRFIWNADATQLIIEPIELLDALGTYRVGLASSATDLSGNRLVSGHAYYLRIDGPDADYVRVTGVKGGYDSLGSVDFSSWPVRIAFDTGKTKTKLEFTFSVPLKESTLVPNMILSTVSGSSSPPKVDTYSYDPATSRLTLQLSAMTITVGEVLQTYRIRIGGGAGGIQDSNGNIMRDDYVFDFAGEE